MERLRFKSSVVPDAMPRGGRQEIVSITSSFYADERRKEEEFIAYLENQVRSGRSGIEGITYDSLKEMLENSKERPTPHPPNFRQQMSREAKGQIFIPAIEAMKSFASIHGITLPNNLIQRIIVLDENTASYVYRAANSKYAILDSPAFTLADKRLCFIDNNYVGEICDEEGRSKEDVIRELGVHELWHSVAYYEAWITQEADRKNSTPELSVKALWRRSGMDTHRPEAKSENFITYSALVEGFTQYLTQETLKPFEKTTRLRDGGGEEIIKVLVGQIGIDPFIQATFTKKGFRVLFDALEKRYGKGAYRKIGGLLTEDYIEDLFGPFTEEDHVFFKKINEFLRSTPPV